MTQPRPLVAGNWKMNGSRASWEEADNLSGRLAADKTVEADVILCPPTTLIAQFTTDLNGSDILVGGQDCHSETSGAHTGDISAEMLADAGANAVIVGHSERRTNHGETSETVHSKAQAAHRAGLIAIICVGETEAERKRGDALSVVSKQLAGSLPEASTADNTVIAYEPVWAIGTGLTPTLDDVGEMHRHIRAELIKKLGEGKASALRILYGGSVKPSNAAELMAVTDVDGALVGGASLKAADFWGIISVYAEK